jgi:hypothetical protein
MVSCRPALDDPDHANAFAASAWEIAALLQHFHPMVTPLSLQVYNSAVESYSTSGGDVDSDSILQKLMRLRSIEVLSKYDSSQGGFQPPIQSPTPVLKLLPEKGNKSAQNSGSQRARTKKQLGDRRKIFYATVSRPSPFVEYLKERSKLSLSSQSNPRKTG